MNYPAYPPRVLPDGYVLSSRAQELFRSYGLMAHTLGVDQAHGNDVGLLLDNVRIYSLLDLLDLLTVEYAFAAYNVLLAYAEEALWFHGLEPELCKNCRDTALAGAAKGFEGSGLNADLYAALTSGAP